MSRYIYRASFFILFVIVYPIVLSAQKVQSDDEKIKDIIVKLSDKDLKIRVRAIEALGEITKDSESIISVLILALNDPAREVRACALWALGKIGSKASTAVPFIIPLLQDKFKNVRACAAECLGKIRVRADLSVPALIAALKNPENMDIGGLQVGSEKFINLTYAIIFALEEIGEEAVPPLIDILLYDKDSLVSYSAFMALWSIVPTAKSSISRFTAALEDNSMLRKFFVARLIGRMGIKGAPAVPSLINALKYPYNSWEIRKEVIEALGKIGPPAIAAIPALTVALNDDNESVRKVTAIALENIRGQK